MTRTQVELMLVHLVLLIRSLSGRRRRLFEGLRLVPVHMSSASSGSRDDVANPEIPLTRRYSDRPRRQAITNDRWFPKSFAYTTRRVDNVDVGGPHFGQTERRKASVVHRDELITVPEGIYAYAMWAKPTSLWGATSATPGATCGYVALGG
jgi:hypothetical protein